MSITVQINFPVIEFEKLRGSILAEKDTKVEISENLNTSLESYLQYVFATLEKTNNATNI